MAIETRDFEAKYWVKTRSSLDPNQSTFMVWSGSIYAFIPGEKRNRLFKMLGVSVSRCIPITENSWDFTSRELTYYLEPETGEILHRWDNPWTQESLTVVHVSNNPVQGCFKGTLPALVSGDQTTYVFDLFTTYPNPLATEPKFAEFSPNPTYQAAELFKISVPTEDLLNPDVVSVSNVQLCWDRIGPWVPWMKMGDRPGHLVYSAYGHKVEGFDELPPLLQDEMNGRMSLYKTAPQSLLDDADMTSWLYFQKHFDTYLRGERFPLPEAGEGS
ncbi:MAG TPA: DUF1838 domain-containing protein [Stenomitos sp.]